MRAARPARSRRRAARSSVSELDAPDAPRRGVRGDQRLRSAAQRYRPRAMSDVSRSALFTDLDTRPILAPLYSRGAPAGNGAPSGAEMSPTGEFASAEIGRAHVRTPVTWPSRMPPSA